MKFLCKDSKCYFLGLGFKEGGGWSSRVLREGYGVGFRKTIKKNWEVLKVLHCNQVLVGQMMWQYLAKRLFPHPIYHCQLKGVVGSKYVAAR